MRPSAASVIGLAALGLLAACTRAESPPSSEEAQAACDRACLIAMAERYLAALAHHAPADAPLARDVRFVENVTRLTPGQGLWASAAGEATEFRLYVADAEAGTIGLMTVIDRRTDTGVAPAQLAARLKIEGGAITEAEHLVADVLEEADPARLVAPRAAFTTPVPPAQRQPRAALAAIATAYYDALVASDGSLAPFAPDCERQENGMITAGPGLAPAPFASVDVEGRAPPAVTRDCVGQMSSRRFAYIDSIDHRRVFAVDPEHGLAMSLSHFRQSMARGPHRLVAADGSETLWAEKRDPYDLPAAHVFKIADGQIHEVEAIGIFVPYDSPTGWE